MVRESARDTVQQLHTLFTLGAAGGLKDAELLRCFLSQDGADAEAAFRVLVERHGPMVMGVCRRMLADHHAAEDAFQATFLVLVRRAGAASRQEKLANWLYGVAVRIAKEARRSGARRLARERAFARQQPVARAADTRPGPIAIGPRRGAEPSARKIPCRARDLRAGGEIAARGGTAARGARGDAFEPSGAGPEALARATRAPGLQHNGLSPHGTGSHGCELGLGFTSRAHGQDRGEHIFRGDRDGPEIRSAADELLGEDKTCEQVHRGCRGWRIARPPGVGRGGGADRSSSSSSRGLTSR